MMTFDLFCTPLYNVAILIAMIFLGCKVASMFSDFAIEFMAENMKISVNSIESKLNEDSFISCRSEIVNAIEYYIDTIQKIETLGGVRHPTGFDKNDAGKDILLYHESLTKLLKNEAIKSVCDSLRHAFCSYACGGMRQLYTCQENDSWYPKILLTEVLEPNDIDTLSDEIILYRGCDITELNNKNFGQAWSTKLEIAEMFAYSHYAHEPWFDESRRCVLKTIMNKNYLFYSNQTGEFEVVVNINKIGDVEIISKLRS